MLIFSLKLISLLRFVLHFYVVQRLTWVVERHYHDTRSSRSTQHIMFCLSPSINQPGWSLRLIILLGRLTIFETRDRQVPKWQRRLESILVPWQGQYQETICPCHCLCFILASDKMQTAIPYADVIERRVYASLRMIGYYHKHYSNIRYLGTPQLCIFDDI